MKDYLTSIKTRLTLFYAAILMLTMVLFGLFSYALISYGLFHNLDQSLSDDFGRAQTVLLQNSGADACEIIQEFETNYGSVFLIYDPVSRTARGSQTIFDAVRSTLLRLTPESLIIPPQSMRTASDAYSLYVAPLNSSDLPGQFLVVGRETGYIFQTLNEYRASLTTFTPVAVLLAAFIGYLLALQALKPVDAITRTANKINSANLDARIPVKGKDELGRLSQTLNHLFDRIDGYIQRQRRFTADASHDLKGPLAVMEVESSMALMKDRPADEYRETIHKLGQEVSRMKLIVEDLLTLAGLDAGVPVDSEGEFDLSLVIESASKTWENACRRKGISLSAEVAPDISFNGNPEHFANVTANLLDNAVKYTPEGGYIRVSLSPENNDIVLRVSDSGTGIPSEKLPFIFERFFRADRSVPGTGLGLSIVQSTVELYRGRVEVESELGTGTTFRVVVPRAS